MLCRRELHPPPLAQRTKLTPSSHPACLVQFTSLQEDAVDAVYDLCEDVDQTVRMTGYRTFEQISRKVTAWVKRNTDVLIQLLQVGQSNLTSYP